MCLGRPLGLLQDDEGLYISATYIPSDNVAEQAAGTTMSKNVNLLSRVFRLFVIVHVSDPHRTNDWKDVDCAEACVRRQGDDITISETLHFMHFSFIAGLLHARFISSFSLHCHHQSLHHSFTADWKHPFHKFFSVPVVVFNQLH